MRLAINGLFLGRPSTGTGQYVINLLRELGNLSQHEILVLRPKWRGGSRRQTEDDPSDGVPGVRVAKVPVPFRGNLGKLWFEQIGVPSAARRLGVDLLHVPYLGSPLFSPCPVVVTVHDLIMLILPDYKGSRSVTLYTKLVCESAKRAAMIIADSKCTEYDIGRLLGIAPSKTRVVYLGCDERYWRKLDENALSAIRKKYDLTKPYVLYIGGLDSRKNVASLIRAFGQVKGDWELAIAGRPHTDNTAVYPALDEALQSSGAAGRIKLLGFVPENDKPALYSAASLFVYPSLYEGFGLPPLEAMACGTPVICSNSSSIPEVVGQGGLLVDPRNCDTLAQAMQEILDKDLLAAALRKMSRQRAQQFSWQNTAMETIAVYDEVFNAAKH